MGRAGGRHQGAGEDALGVQCDGLLPGRGGVEATGLQTAQEHVLVGVEHQELGHGRGSWE